MKPVVYGYEVEYSSGAAGWPPLKYALKFIDLKIFLCFSKADEVSKVSVLACKSFKVDE